ncbi:MAG: cysteine synthase family protein [Myxococcota bacterium]
MSGAAFSVAELVGNTPLVRLTAIDKETPGVEIWAKLEFTNPGGSIKDRPALQMLLDAEAEGRLRPGMSIIDSTSGNTGIALALYGGARGYQVSLVMPSNVSTARKSLVAAYGAQILYSDPLEGSDGAIRMVRKLTSEEPSRYFYTDQYGNPSNPRAHFLTTGPEILSALGDRLTHFVTGIGTSGTLIGTGRRMKRHDPRIQVIGVEPDDAFHGLEGLKHLKTSIVPRIYDSNVLDETLFIDTESGWVTTDRLTREEGLWVGHSSGANVEGALRVARRLVEEKRTGVIATILCDHASRYVEPKRSEP